MTIVGEIDYSEFKKVMAGSFFKKYSRQELQSAFRKFDADGNGYITTAELSHILSRMGRHLSRADVDANGEIIRFKWRWKNFF